MRKKNEKDSRLLQSPIFADMPEENLADIARIGEDKVVPAHTIIFRQGDPGDSYYFINSGKVRVFRKSGEGVETNLAQLCPGDSFGEIALLTGEPRSAYVEAMEETCLTVLPRDQFDRILRNNPGVALAFVKQLANWLLRDDLRLEMAEELRKINEELGKINEELKGFVDVVSHDLKTPIIAIQGFSARLLKNYEDELGEKGLMYLEMIKASACRMEALVSDLLALSRIGRVVSEFEDVPCLEIVKNVTSGLQDRLKEKGIELVVAENLPTIYCDGERMYQVFENLVVNAIKFIGDAKTPKIEIGYEDRGYFYQFHVRDNGIGIDPKYHRKIFKMFQRLKEIKDVEGTGLGLAIVDGIVSSYGGRVWMESEKGKGATFYFTLPKPSCPRYRT